MSSRRLAVGAAVCGTIALAGWVAAGPLDFTSLHANLTAAWMVPAAPIDAPAPFAAAAPIAESPASSALAYAEPIEAIPAAKNMDLPVGEAAIVQAVLSVPAPEMPAAQLASLGTPDPVPDRAIEPLSAVTMNDECVAAQSCIDQYLWSVYQRTPKLDTIKVSEQVKVTIKKKGKTRTVTKTVVKLVDEDFTWKDPKAAEKAGMPMIDYVIGGMDRSFKLKLYHALRAMDAAGLEPGITSGFRDDYRQALASGKKAANDSSYHGGSRRGGYGHGLAADLVSVKGETRAQRWITSDILWKWVDEHGKEFGVGRPYLDRDPPHVGPIDGKEYADKRGRAKAKVARVEMNKRPGSAIKDDRAKSARTAPPKARSI